MSQHEDKMTMRILDDGTIRTITEGLHGVNHGSADDLVKTIERAAGGAVTVAKRGDHKHRDQKHHDHVHQKH